jgi:N6-adenosine-specific RNA methylase IME4
MAWIGKLIMDLKNYKVILADAPWRYQNWSDKKHGAAKSHYSCMSVQDIAKLPVNKIGSKNCALFFWIPFPKLVEGAHLKIMDSWGFRPVTCVFVWNKINRAGKAYTGLGFYSRSGTEPCLLGIRGKMPRKKEATKVMQVITAPRIYRHSTKPVEQYDRIEQLFNGPYLELFARDRRNGWDCWGNEIDNDIEMPDLNKIEG